MLTRLTAPLAFAATALLLAGCARNGEIDVTSGVGITASRTVCPAVGIPAHTGDITLFDPPQSRDAAAIDVVAAITNLRTTCNPDGAQVYSTTSFDVVASRLRAGPAREVVIPYYSAVVQGGTQIVSKDESRLVVRFEDGQTRATARGQVGAYVDRASATLSDDIRQRITRQRRAGDQDAAVDPLADPEVRAAVARATFEVFLGFALTRDQLAYNVTR